MSKSLLSKNLTVVTIFKDNPEDVDIVVNSLRQVGFMGEHLIWDGGTSPHHPDTEVSQRWTIRYHAGKDAGPFDAMNKALKFVTTDYVIFMNSGDAFHPAVSLDYLLGFLDDDQEGRWLVGKAMSVSNGKEVGLWPSPDFPSWIRRIGIQSWNHQSTIYKTNLLHEVGGFSGGEILADWVTNMNLERITPPILLDYTIALFDVGGMSSKLSGYRWIREHAKSWIQVFGGNYYFQIAKYSLGLVLKDSLQNPILRRLLFLRRKRLEISRRFLNRALQFLANHRNLRLVVLSTLRKLGVYDLLLRSASRIVGKKAPEVARPRKSPPVFAETKRLIKTSRSNGAQCLVIDDLISQLAPSRGIERFWQGFLSASAQIPDLQITILSRTGRLDTFADNVIHLPELNPDQIAIATREIDAAIETLNIDGPLTFASSYYTMSARWPNLTFVHDLIPEIVGFHGTPIWEQRINAIKNSNFLIALSQNTMSDFSRFYPEHAHKLSFIRMGINTEIFRPRSVLEQNRALHKFGIPKEPFVVYVGSRTFYKDADKLMHLVKHRAWPINVVFVGGEPMSNGKKRFWIQPDDLDLSAVYSAAVATVVTSSYEGFGFPALESSACGTPVICRNNSSLPEASLGRAIYVDDFGFDETLRAINLAETLKNDYGFSTDLTQLASERSWDNFTKDFLELNSRNLRDAKN